MQRKFMTVQVMLACHSKSRLKDKDIHEELAKTLLERKALLRQLQEKEEGAQKIIVMDITQKPAA